MTEDQQTHKEAVIQISATVSLAVIVIVGGIIFYHQVEHLSWLDAWYFVIMTLTTVGYGDIAPETSIGKLITPIFVIIGIGLITSFITGLNKVVVKRRAKKIAAKNSKKQ